MENDLVASVLLGEVPRLTHHYDFSRCSYWRDTSGGTNIIDNQKVSAGAAGKALPVCSDNRCGITDIQL